MARIALPLAAFLVGLCVAAADRAAVAREIHVHNVAGDDALTGGLATRSGGEGPVRTISRALELAQFADHVIVANTGQPYREAIAIAGPRLQGSERRPFVLRSDGAVLDGTVAAAEGAWRHVEGDVFALRPRRLAYQQLFNDGAPLRRARLTSAATHADSLQKLEWALVSNALLLRVEEARLPDSYDLRHAGLQTGITLYGVRHVVIEGFVVQGFQQDGVNAHELARDVVFRDVECRANGRSGLSVGGASRVRVERSQFYDNGRVQVRCEGLARLALNGCEVDDKSANRFATPGGRLTVDGDAVLAP